MSGAEDCMRRTGMAVLLASAVIAGPLSAQPRAAEGVYHVDFQVHLGAALPSGALVTCKVRLAPAAPGAAQMQAVGVATVQGSTAHCAVEIPAAWAAPARLSYEIDAAEPGMVVRTATGEAVGLPEPPAGGVERLDLSLAL